MTIDEVKKKHNLTDAQVADYADKYIRGRARQRGTAVKQRTELKQFRELKKAGKIPGLTPAVA